MASRRGFLSGLVSAGLYPRLGWADAGSPVFLAAGRKADGRYGVFGLDRRGQTVFDVAIPARGHAAAAHPTAPEAVAFARRPGRFAIVINCVTGQEVARLTAPEGRHFYGHGAFARDGDRLFTTENDYEAGEGRIGIWDARDGYRRIGEISSGGVGPHDLRLTPDGQTLVVANGGIETHPDSGRAKLNLPMMQPNLSYLSLDGGMSETVELPQEHRLNSIRHLDIRPDGMVAFAMQWQGDLGQVLPVLGVHQRGQTPNVLATTTAEDRAMKGYGGSVVFWDKGRQLAVSSPRGDRVQLYDVAARRASGELHMQDVCGLGELDGALIATSGTGEVSRTHAQTRRISKASITWDNHMVPVNRG